MGTMESELKFLNLFGFRIVELQGYNNTRWNILDENDNVVGTIQKKKIHNKNKHKGTHAVFGYVTNIDNGFISCKKLTKINNNEGKGTYDNPYYYEFTVKRGEDTDTINLDLDETPSITIWSKEYGYMSFSLSYDKLFTNFKSKTENFNTEEVIVYEWDNRDKESYGDYKREYTYQLAYCDKSIPLTDSDSKGRTTREISAKYSPHYQRQNQIELQEITWINGKLRTNRKNTYDGTVEEVVERQQMGIEAMSHFRHILNSILPVKQDIMSVMLARSPYVVEQGVGMFFPDVIEELTQNPCLDCSSKGSCDMLEITEQQCLTLKKHKQVTGQPYIKVK